MKLRLLLTEKCNRRCKGCCNKEWNLSILPLCKSFVGYGEILITGGEPLLFPELLKETVDKIRQETTTPIFLYTAYRENPDVVIQALEIVDGITLTLHSIKDVPSFNLLNEIIKANSKLSSKSLRLNVFRGINIKHIDTSLWIIKDNMTWIKDCPLPVNEVFMRVQND